ncbi:hypothetical protein C0Q66_02065 [Streptomyces albidoflavus]|nr:hypothetical protein C0Q66_02065 [Streptomyces albidoflavus]
MGLAWACLGGMLPAWQDRAGELPGAGVLPAASTWQRRLLGLRDRLPGRRGRGSGGWALLTGASGGAGDSLMGSCDVFGSAGCHVMRLGVPAVSRGAVE